MLTLSIVSFFPPSTTIRRYQRASLATTGSEIGAIYCAILSYAHSGSKEDLADINASILAIRSKIRRSVVLRTNVVYEVRVHFYFFSDAILALMNVQFSLRGRWPIERYNTLSEIQLWVFVLQLAPDFS